MKTKTIVVGALETNCYLVYCEETRICAVVDPGAEPERIFPEIYEEGLKPALIINTHGHIDHTGANRDIKDKFGVPLVIHAADGPMLGKTQSLELSLFLGAKDSPPADRFVADGDAIEIGRGALRVLHTPGHTPGKHQPARRRISLVRGHALLRGRRPDRPPGRVRQAAREIDPDQDHDASRRDRRLARPWPAHDHRPGTREQPPPHMTPAEPAAEDVRAQFLAFMKFESRLSDNTVQSYGRDIAKYLVFLGQAKVPLDRVRETDVVRFVQGQSAAGLAPRSMARLISALKAFYKFLILDGRVTKNPTVHLSSPKAWFSLPKFLTIKEVGTLLRQPDKATPVASGTGRCSKRCMPPDSAYPSSSGSG